MVVIYTTGDGKAYMAADGTLLVVGGDELNLVTDRVASDVEEVRLLAESIKAGTATAEQVQEYLNALHKGAYTYQDLNRVEEAVAYVAGRLIECGYLSVVPVTESWSVTDKPNEADFSRYFGNVSRLREAIAVWPHTPPAPTTVTGFDYNKANALEQILVDVDQILNLMRDAWFYSGDLYLAEV